MPIPKAELSHIMMWGKCGLVAATCAIPVYHELSVCCTVRPWSHKQAKFICWKVKYLEPKRWLLWNLC